MSVVLRKLMKVKVNVFQSSFFFIFTWHWGFYMKGNTIIHSDITATEFLWTLWLWYFCSYVTWHLCLHIYMWLRKCQYSHDVVRDHKTTIYTQAHQCHVTPPTIRHCRERTPGLCRTCTSVIYTIQPSPPLIINHWHIWEQWLISLLNKRQIQSLYSSEPLHFFLLCSHCQSCEAT